MLDINFIRENPDTVKDAAKNKGVEVDIDQLLAVDGQRRELLTQVDDQREMRNKHAAELKKGKPTPGQIQEGKSIKEKMQALEEELAPIEKTYKEIMLKVPNIPLPSVPVGSSEDENQIEREFGQKPNFDFEPKTHWGIAQKKDWIDKERAAKVAGARFAYLKGDMVRMQFAIIQYCMNTLSDENVIKKVAQDLKLDISTKPFTPVLPPMMIKTDVFDAMGRLEPREDRFRAGEPEDELWLQGSAEHTVGSMYYKEVVDEADLPLRYIGYATSFRREAGTYGKDTEGIFRMHQFDKCEMECFTTPEDGEKEHLLLVGLQEHMMQELGLHYRFIRKCTADIGTPNAAGIDLDTWLPGQGQYRETSTADFMTDFQTRRMQSRVKRADGSIDFMNTNDATALVLSRIPIAIIENYQTAEGDVIVPEVLRPYMGGVEKI